jgi:4-carboxymuconolactone decarboxylase
MGVPKVLSIVLLATIVGVLGGNTVNAQPPAQNAESPAASVLPKDVYPDSRNRFPLPQREDMDDYGKKVFDELNAFPEIAPTPLRLYSPKLAKPLGEAHHYLKYETGFPDRLIEIAVMVTARELDNQYEWTQWETRARTPGDRQVEPAIIDIIKYGRPVAGLGEKETVIINFGREMFGQKKVSSATFGEAVRLFGRRGTVDLIELMALYSATAAELNAVDMQLQRGQKPLLPAR